MMDQLAWLFDQPPFDQLDSGGRARLKADTQITYLPEKAFVGRVGDELDAVWMVRRGAVRRHQPGPDVVIEEGELIGSGEALEQRPLAHDLEVLEDLLAYLIPVQAFRSLADDGIIRQTLDRRRGADTSGLAATVRTVAGRAHHIDADASVAEAARIMERVGVDALLVDGAVGPTTPAVGEGPGATLAARPSGDDGPAILTARDLRSRVLAHDLGPDTRVGDVATHSARTLDPETPLAEALVFLLEHDIHHAPLSGANQGHLMLSDDDILAFFGSDAFSLLRRLTTQVGELDQFTDNVTRAVTSMVRADIGPGTIGRAVSSLVDGLMRSLCRQAEAELGPPPAPYALCACGSQGRREQTLLTDQDNLLVHAGPDDHPWYGELATRVVDGLISAGIPACDGGYMATNWHGSLDWWTSMVAGWAADPGPDALLDINITADLRVVVGDLPAAEVWAPLHRAMDRPLLVQRLGAEVIRFRPPGRFSRFFGRGADFDLKKHGLIPIVGLGRLFGLELGLSTASTTARLQEAAAAGLISDHARTWLTDGLAFLTGLRLDSQLRSIATTGKATSLALHRDDLDPVERSLLRETLRAVSEVQHTTSDRLGLDAVA